MFHCELCQNKSYLPEHEYRMPINEEPREYIVRLLSYVDAEPLQIQRSTSSVLRSMIAGVAPYRLAAKPSPDRWSVAEILAHLADAELVGGFRYRMIIAEPECAIPAYNQNAWCQNLRYAERDSHASLNTFDAIRCVNLALLDSLTPSQWQHRGHHAERGVETVAHMAKMFAGHDRNHIQQISNILSAENLSPERAHASRASLSLATHLGISLLATPPYPRIKPCITPRPR